MRKFLLATAATVLMAAPAFAQSDPSDATDPAAAFFGIVFAAFFIIGIAGWIATLVTICKRQSGGACAGLIILSFFFWPLALIISLCMGKPQPTIVYHMAPGQLPPQA